MSDLVFILCYAGKWKHIRILRNLLFTVPLPPCFNVAGVFAIISASKFAGGYFYAHWWMNIHAERGSDTSGTQKGIGSCQKRAMPFFDKLNQSALDFSPVCVS